MDIGAEKQLVEPIALEQNNIKNDAVAIPVSNEVFDAIAAVRSSIVTYHGMNTKTKSDHSERRPSKPATVRPKFYGGSHAKF